jgi:hypothetical protein
MGEFMKNLKIIIFTLIVSIVWFNPAAAQDKVGTNAAPFLGINIGGAATAMGGAFVSMARDASALYWNPGAVARLGKSYVSFAHTRWFVDTDYNWGGVIINFDGNSAVGLNIAVLDYGEENVTTVKNPGGTGEKWSAQDLYAAVTYSRNLTERFSIGGTLKLVQQKIYNESATGFAVDLGLLYITRFNGMRLGVSISNFGTDMQMDGKDLLNPFDQDPENLGNNPTISAKLNTDTWPMPLFFRVGASMNLITFGESTLLVASDALIPADNSTVLNVGVEYNWKEFFFLRGGYKSLGREDTEEGITAGIGIQYFINGLGNVNFDYGYNDYGLLEEIHTLGFGFSF